MPIKMNYILTVLINSLTPMMTQTCEVPRTLVYFSQKPSTLCSRVFSNRIFISSNKHIIKAKKSQNRPVFEPARTVNSKIAPSSPCASMYTQPNMKELKKKRRRRISSEAIVLLPLCLPQATTYHLEPHSLVLLELLHLALLFTFSSSLLDLYGRTQ